MNKKKKYIRLLLAVSLLAVFSFAITPKQFLHYMFAKHVDVSSHYLSGQHDNINTSGFHCNCNDVVAEMPFTGLTDTPFNPVIVQSNYVLSGNTTIETIFPIRLSDRGPPKLI